MAFAGTAAVNNGDFVWYVNGTSATKLVWEPEKDEEREVREIRARIEALLGPAAPEWSDAMSKELNPVVTALLANQERLVREIEALKAEKAKAWVNVLAAAEKEILTLKCRAEIKDDDFQYLKDRWTECQNQHLG